LQAESVTFCYDADYGNSNFIKTNSFSNRNRSVFSAYLLGSPLYFTVQTGQKVSSEETRIQAME